MANGSSTFSPSRNAGNGETGAITASTASTPARNRAQSERALSAPLNSMRHNSQRSTHKFPNNAAFALISKPFAACVAIHSGESFRSRRTCCIAHAVVSRQVRTRLRSRDDVIACNGGIRRWQTDLAHFAALAPQFLDGARNQLGGFARRIAHILARQSKLQSGNWFVERRRIFRERRRSRGRIGRIVSCDHAQKRRCVFHRACEGADVIERTGEGREPITRNAPIRRHGSHHATEGRRMADGSTGVGAEECMAVP